MSKEMKSLAAKDRIVLLSFLFILLALLIASLLLPIVFTVVFVNFFLLFMLVLFFVLYLDKKDEGKAKPPLHYPDITVLVPVYNSKRTIVECIESIKKISYPKKFEIIAVDDGSTDGSRELLEKMGGIRLIKLKQNSGKAIALNTGLTKVKTEYVACIDSDTYPEKEVFLKTMGYFADKKVGAVTCLILPDKSQSIIQKIQFFEYALGFGLWTTLLSSINSMTMIPGPMTIFRKKFFDEAGGYDDGNLTEDMEIGLRLQKYGYRIKTCFEASALTDIPDTWNKLFRQRDRWYRGRVFNLMNYKKLFFNRANPDLGFFSLPYLFSMELVSIMLLFRLIVLFSANFFKFVAVEGGIVSFTNSFGIMLGEIIFPSSTILFVCSYLLVGTFTYLGLKIIHYKPSGLDYLVILINVLLFPFFITVVYFQGFVKEMLGVRSEWVRVTT